VGCPYNGTSYTTPNTSDSVWKVANKVKELGLYKFESGMEGNETAKKTVNIISLVEKRLRRLHGGYLEGDDQTHDE